MSFELSKEDIPKLPHFRFVINREHELCLVLKILFSTINTGSLNPKEKDSIKAFLKVFMQEFMSVKVAGSLEDFVFQTLTEPAFSYLQDNDYFDLKVAGKLDIPDFCGDDQGGVDQKIDIFDCYLSDREMEGDQKANPLNFFKGEEAVSDPTFLPIYK